MRKKNVHTNKIMRKAYTYYLFLKPKLLNQPNFPKIYLNYVKLDSYIKVFMS